MEVKFKNKTYDVIGNLPIGDTDTDVLHAAGTVTVKVLCGNRAHRYAWRIVKTGPTKHRVLLAAIRHRIGR